MVIKHYSVCSCSHCHGQGSKQCDTCRGKQQLLVYINLTVKWCYFLNTVYLSTLFLSVDQHLSLFCTFNWYVTVVKIKPHKLFSGPTTLKTMLWNSQADCSWTTSARCLGRSFSETLSVWYVSHFLGGHNTNEMETFKHKTRRLLRFW